MTDPSTITFAGLTWEGRGTWVLWWQDAEGRHADADLLAEFTRHQDMEAQDAAAKYLGIPSTDIEIDD